LLGGPGKGFLSQGPSGAGERDAGWAVRQLDLHRLDAGPERPLDLLAAPDQLQDVKERGPLQLPAVGRAGDPDAAGAEERSERRGLTAGGARGEPGAAVQLEPGRPPRPAEAKAERSHGARWRDSRGMTERAEPLADRAAARGRNRGLLEVAQELLAGPDDGL